VYRRLTEKNIVFAMQGAEVIEIAENVSSELFAKSSEKN